MYRFKFYYKDGTSEISNFGMEKVEDLYYDFDGLIEWNEYYSFDELKPTSQEVLEVAMRAYKDFYKDFKRIEIIDDNNESVIDYINEGDLVHRNLQREKIIKELNDEDLKEKNRERKPSNLIYSFKNYYRDGSSEIKGSAVSINSLLCCLDEYVNETDYNVKDNMNAEDILKIAAGIYGKNLGCYRIEIINNKTKEVINYIDINGK